MTGNLRRSTAPIGRNSSANSSPALEDRPAPPPCSIHEGEAGKGLGSGLGAWTTLEARCNAATKELRRSLNEKVLTRKIRPVGGPQDLFYEMENWKNHPERMEENIPVYPCEDIHHPTRHLERLPGHQQQGLPATARSTSTVSGRR